MTDTKYSAGYTNGEAYTVFDEKGNIVTRERFATLEQAQRHADGMNRALHQMRNERAAQLRCD